MESRKSSEEKNYNNKYVSIIYKKLTEYVCVVVNITATEAFVSTYPVSKKVIDKLENRE